jgi:hypothetical protein
MEQLVQLEKMDAALEEVMVDDSITLVAQIAHETKGSEVDGLLLTYIHLVFINV